MIDLIRLVILAPCGHHILRIPIRFEFEFDPVSSFENTKFEKLSVITFNVHDE